MPGIYDVTAAFDGTLEKVDLRRQTPGAFVEGEWIPGAETIQEIEVTIQPINTGEFLEQIPEGDRQKKAKMFWGVDEIKPGDKDAQIEADLITTGNETYKIVSVEDWLTIGGYFESIGVKT